MTTRGDARPAAELRCGTGGTATAASYRYIEDGIVVVRDGRIAAVGEAELLPTLPPGTPVDHYPDGLILPGLIDTHIHCPQTQVIASYGAQLLEWLQKYTFVEEQTLRRSGAHAERNAGFFLDELLRNGTTTAVVYCTVHPESVEAFFAESERRGTAMIAGKVMMDRGAPPGLLDTRGARLRRKPGADRALARQGRQLYAVTPRFAITSTEAQLEAAGALLRSTPDCYMQTHLSENLDEIATVRRLFPEADDYTDVYDRYGLLGPALAVRPLHPSGRRRSAAAVGEPVGRGVLPDLEPVHRQRACSTCERCRDRRGRCGSASRPMSAAAPAIRCCGRPPRATRCCSCGGQNLPALMRST